MIDAFAARASSRARRTRASARRRSRPGRSRRSRPDDLVFATYRGHGEALIKGVDPVSMMAELMGRATGVCKGKGGSMHLSEPVRRARLDQRDRGRPHPDGRRRRAVLPVPAAPARSCSASSATAPRARASSSRRMNMAMLWKVPLVFICENNGIAISVPDLEEPGDARHRRPCPRLRHAGGDRRRQRRRSRCARPSPRASRAPGRATARRSSSARPSAGSATPRSRPEEAIRRSSAARGSGSTRSRVSGRRLSPGASRPTPTSTISRRRTRAEMRAVRDEAERAPFPAPDSIYEDIFAP